MNPKERAEKRKRISQDINIFRSAFADDDLNILYDMVTHKEKYNRMRRSFRRVPKGKHGRCYIPGCNDSNFSDERKTYIIIADEIGVRILELYSYSDSGGESNSHTGNKSNAGDDNKITNIPGTHTMITHKTGREIIKIYNAAFLSAFCGPQWPPVRLPVATRRCQWTGLISYFSFDHYDVMFRHPFEKRVGGNLILHQHRRPCLWLALRADNAAP